MTIRLFIFLSLLFPTIALSQAIFSNNIDGPDPSDTNPFTAGQYVDPNIMVSGIGFGPGLSANIGDNRFNTRGWSTSTTIAVDYNDYFEFTITPKPGYKISFSNFRCNAQVSADGPKNFRIVSGGFVVSRSINYADLSGIYFQDVVDPISFIIVGGGASSTLGTLSINDFAFSGMVECILGSAAPTIRKVIQPQCENLANPSPDRGGSIELSGLPASGSWDLYQNGALIKSGGTGTSVVIDKLLSGAYHFHVVQGDCTSAVTEDIPISIPTTVWDGTTWSKGIPDQNKNIVFKGDYGLPDNITACSCEVDSGLVTIKSGNSLKLTRELKVKSGSLAFEDGASLVQIDDASINSGNIIYKRNTTPIGNLDYTYWCSPVESQTLFNLSPTTLSDKFYSFNAGIRNWKQENSLTKMFPGRGYIIRGPETHAAPAPPSPYTAGFVGVANNGIYITPIGEAASFNLIGNPYPSALDANTFLTNNSTVLEGTIYFWTHNTPIQRTTNPLGGLDIYAYTSDDYAAYNSTGGVATQAPSSGNAGAVNTNAPSGKIASGQAFFAVSKTAGNCIFNNSMRVGVGSISGNNSQFFRGAGSSVKNAVSAIEKNRIWLNLFNNQGAFKQILVGYITGASNNYDSRFDGPSFNGNSFLDFYSILDTKNLVIQGRALPFKESEEVPLGYKSTIKGEFSIGLAQADGILADKEVYLKDELLHLVHNLKSSPYTFSTEKGNFNKRFVVSYQNKTLATTSIKDQTDEVLISSKDKLISIKTNNEVIDEIAVYSIDGKQLFRKNNISASNFTINSITSISQVLIVKVSLKNGKSFSQKIVF